MTNSYDKSYLKIALPAAFEGLFMILLASTDLIMVGTLGAFPIAAVSIFAQPRLVLLCFSRSLASSVTLLVSRKADEAGKEAASSIMKKSLTVCALLLGMLHILFFLFLEDILYLMGATPDYISLAMDYSVPALIATYFTSLTLILQAVQLGYGKTAVIMKTNVAGNIINVILNFILIFGIGPVPAMGVAGAAIGTVFATLFTLIATAAILRGDGFFAESSYVPDKDYSARYFQSSAASLASRAAKEPAWSSSPAWRQALAPSPLPSTASA